MGFLGKQYHSLTYIRKSKYVARLNFYLLQSQKIYGPKELPNEISSYPWCYFFINVYMRHRCDRKSSITLILSS